MNIEQIKETIHLRVEQADEKLLRVLAQLTETLFAEYQSEDKEKIEEESGLWTKPLTTEESLADIREGIEEYHRGEYVTLDEIDKEVPKW